MLLKIPDVHTVTAEPVQCRLLALTAGPHDAQEGARHGSTVPRWSGSRGRRTGETWPATSSWARRCSGCPSPLRRSAGRLSSSACLPNHVAGPPRTRLRRSRRRFTFGTVRGCRWPSASECDEACVSWQVPLHRQASVGHYDSAVEECVSVFAHVVSRRPHRRRCLGSTVLTSVFLLVQTSSLMQRTVRFRASFRWVGVSASGETW